MHKLLPAALLALALPVSAQLPSALPTVRDGQFLVHGQPTLLLGGELGNSSAGTASQADAILPRLAANHVDTVLMPVPWEEIEPTEGRFDFTVLDHWVETARSNHQHLVLLWFGAWKNALSSYAPGWVKADSRRFPRVIGEDGRPLEILSNHSPAVLAADRTAYVALMRHLRDTDAEQQTILMVQVENEIGILGSARDRSPEAGRLFAEQVPAALTRALLADSAHLTPELRAVWSGREGTWQQEFGENAPEIFTAWYYARYVNAVAEAGKAVYALPMYTNAQLPAPRERPGEYPAGAPYPGLLDIYRAGAPAITFFAPDIYWPDFEYWVDRYREHGNPVFVPEARLEPSPWNVLYAFGEADAFGFSAFGVDSLPAMDARRPGISLPDVYAQLDGLRPRLLLAEQEHRTRGVVLRKDSPRAVRTVSLGGYLFSASLSRTWPSNQLAADNGGVLILQAGPNEFYLVGNALRLLVHKDLDAGPADGPRTAGIDTIEEGDFVNGQWTVSRVLNGDQSNQGRAIDLPAGRFATLRVRLYTIP